MTISGESKPTLARHHPSWAEFGHYVEKAKSENKEETTEIGIENDNSAQQKFPFIQPADVSKCPFMQQEQVRAKPYWIKNFIEGSQSMDTLHFKSAVGLILICLFYLL